MKFSALFKKKESVKVPQKDIDEVLFEAGKELIKLKDKFAVTLQRELTVARRNKEKGIKNSGNYSRIGIAYYSLNVIQDVQERVRSMTSTRDLYNCMNDMTAVIGMINGIAGKMGKLDPKGIVSGLKKMSGDDGGASKDLLKTLAALSGAKLETEDNVPIDTLVSVDVIEKLIAGADPDHCVKASDGIITNTGDVMDVISQVIGGTTSETDPDDTTPTMQEINDLLSKL